MMSNSQYFNRAVLLPFVVPNIPVTKKLIRFALAMFAVTFAVNAAQVP
jgi:hypothetical protein